MMRTIVVLLLTTTMACWGCSSAKPSETDATNALNALCQSQDKLCKVNSLVKTNGQASEVSKVSHYQLEYQAEVECLKVPHSEWPLDYMPVVNCNRIGDVKKVAGVLEFVQTEKGWQPIIARDNISNGRPQEIK